MIPISHSSKLFTPIGTRAIGLAWANVIRAFAMGEIDGIINHLRILAATPGDSEIIKQFNKWKEDIDKEKEVMLSERDYVQADKMPRLLEVQKFLNEKNYEIYENLIKLLNEKNLLDFETGAKPKYPQKGHLTVPAKSP